MAVNNTLSVYDPIFYAQQGIFQLEKALGMANRVFRGYDRNPQERGSTIQIKKPSTFEAKDAPGDDQDITASSVSVVLDQWKEVKFSLTDKELTYTGEQIVTDHIRPAAYALADCIDLALCGLYKDVPWFTGSAGTTPDGVEDLTGTRKVLFDNKVPLNDPAAVHLMLSSAAEEKFLQLSAFTQQQGAGDVGVASQLRGTLGTKFGMEIFANQNVLTHAKGTYAATGTPNLTGAHSKGASTISFDSTTLTGTLKAGDTLVIAGNTQRYAVTALATAAADAITCSITPPLVQDYSADSTVTPTLQDGVRNMGFHQNAFALAMAPLSEMGEGLGARIATITDPITGLSLRSRVWYEGNASRVHVGLDVLYGVKTLDPNKAVLLLG